MSNTVIRVENVSKKYQLGNIGTGSLTRDLNRWWANVRGKEDPNRQIGTNGALSGEHWALRDVSFDIIQGEAVGIIGKNGAGKSTLLKILSRVTTPTSGSIKIKGRIASLLEVGTGFHPDLSGRENIFLNGAILGMHKAEIKAKLDEIVDFSGVEKYIDTPVKRYSSGMYVRLAFAVAAHLESEILILDEVLAVGDAEFQKKCLGKMNDVTKSEGRTVLFVSHNLSAISKLCSKGVLLSSGQLLKNDTVDTCLAIYSQLDSKSLGSTWVRIEPLNNTLNFREATLLLNKSESNLRLDISIILQSLSEHKKAFIAINISDSTAVIMQAIPESIPFIEVAPEQNLGLTIDLPPLIPSIYYVSIWCGNHYTNTYDYKENILSFEIFESPLKERSFPHSKAHGYIIPSSKINS